MFTTDSSRAMLINQPDSFNSSTPVNLVATSSWGGTYYNIAVTSYSKNPVFNSNTGYDSIITQCAQDRKFQSVKFFQFNPMKQTS